MLKIICVVVFSLVLCIQQSLGQQTTQKLQDFDDKIIQLMEDYKAVGLSVAVVKDNEVVYSKGFGYRDLENKLLADENTAFHIASMTKAFTAGLLGFLESTQQLSLSDKPALYIPHFQFYNEKMNNLISIGDLLSHRSGIGNHGTSIVMFPENDKLKTVQRLKYLKPQGEIKNSYLYSNIGYTIAGTIVEQVTQNSWEDNIKEAFFEPLNMQSSYTTLDGMLKSNNYAKGYAMFEDEILNVPFENYYSYAPAGAIKSSAKDLSHWMMAWLNHGVFEGYQVLPKEYVRKATQLQNLKNEVYEKDAFLYGDGYGWRLRAWNGIYRVRHGGNTMGFSSVMDLYPFEGIGVVVLTNQKSSLLPYAISDYISRKLMNLPEFDFPVKVDDIYRSKTEDLELNNAKKPINALKEFVGKYDAEGYGEIDVVFEQNKLFAIFPTYRFQLAHLNFNSFYLKGTEDFAGEFNPEFTVEFCNDLNGEISNLKLYSQKEPIVFKKINSGLEPVE
jgi:CubicO group peptidase (beta-lactamase class C family)